jgi:hypothetical protein
LNCTNPQKVISLKDLSPPKVMKKTVAKKKVSVKKELPDSRPHIFIDVSSGEEM